MNQGVRRGPGSTPSRTLTVGCLNVRGCGDEGKREEIGNLFQRRNFDVLALSETKLKGRGQVKFGCMYGRVSGITRGRAREGVALLLKEELLQHVVEWREVSSRIMWVKMKMGLNVWVFVSVYGPGGERDEQERDDFWNDLNDCLGNFGNNCNVVIMGDMNARVGAEQIEGVIGRYGVPGRNENGDRMLNVCMERELTVGNTLFKKKSIHKYTWVRVIGGNVVDRGLLDFVVVSKGVVGKLLDINVFRGESEGISDHFLVEGKIKDVGNWRTVKRGCIREILKVNELYDSSKESEYKNKLWNEWRQVRIKEMGGVEEEWAVFKEKILKCAMNVCGVRKVGGNRRKGSEWWNEEVEAAVLEKRRAYEEWLQRGNDISYESYRQKRLEVKRIVREAKRNADVRWGRGLSENFERNKKMFWKEVKRVRGGENANEERVRGQDGEVLPDEEGVRNRWAEYFEDLLNINDVREIDGGGEVNVPDIEVGGVNERAITLVEIEKAVREMKPGRAPGLDGCAVECLKQGGMALMEWLERVFNLCLNEGVVPADWRSACIVPLYKGKGDKAVCSNYRGISLLSVVGKVYAKIIIERIRNGTDGVIGEEQCGFRRGRGCVDQIFTVRNVSEKYMSRGKDIYWAFMDLEKAYDRIDRENLWGVLERYGVRGAVLQAVKSFYEGSRACVRVRNEVSRWFEVKTGLRQGCVMSPWLFNIYMDEVVNEVNAQVHGEGIELLDENGREWFLNQLLFADDTALVAGSEENLRTLVGAFDRVCVRKKLKVNAGKSKVMRCSRYPQAGNLNITLNGERLEQMNLFKYLGSHVSYDGKVEQEVCQKVKEASKCLGGIKSMMSNRYMGMNVKQRLYQAVIVPTVLYGAETWNVSEADKKRLNVFEMRCLRNMVGVSRRDRMRNQTIRYRAGVMEKLSSRVEKKGVRVVRASGKNE